MDLKRRDRIYWKIAALLVLAAVIFGGVAGGAYGAEYMLFPSIAVAFAFWLVMIAAIKLFAWIAQ